MGKIVGSFACSHAPQIVSKPNITDIYQKQVEEVQVGLESLGRKIEKLNPDTVILIGADHLESFFFDNYPMILIPVTKKVSGTMGNESYTYETDEELSRSLLFNLVNGGFDVSFAQKFKLDHPFYSPLKFIFKEYTKPIIPIHINSNVPPLISIKRAFLIGKEIRNIIQSNSNKNVVVIGTGGLSHYPGTPFYGKVDLDFDNKLLSNIEKGLVKKIINLEPEKVENAGNLELRTWVAAMGAAGKFKGDVLLHVPTFHIDYSIVWFKEVPE